ncbi:hypothetical protein DFH29DRAFT_546065 [Suillus ampliporus]|nr:hypothetical protein DFH29DRAFT_546065 [Suillus ampliporus]
MTHFRVFLGAPSVSDLKRDTYSYTWKTIEPPSAEASLALVYPPATIEAASRRISLLYQNIIFDDSNEEAFDQEPAGQGAWPEGSQPMMKEETTVITWPPTPVANTTGAPSFLRTSQSQSQSQLAATYETQETTSVSYSDASSIARFPHFQISLHKVSSLASLYSENITRGRKVNILLATLEVEGPDTVRVKKGLDVGKEVSVLKMILGDEDGSVCKLTAWREVADAWGVLGLKRGDIIYLENLTPACEPGSSITLTASPYNKPTAEICFRTMPYTREDNRLRPDLRLAQSDAAVKKVAALTQWFERMAGLVIG